MKTSKLRITVIVVLCLAALCSIILLPPLLTPEPTLESAINKAVDFFDDTKEPYALLWMDVIYRKFGITEFSGALQRYDQLISEEPKNVALLRIFRRISVCDNEFQKRDLDSLYAEVDHLVVPALYCNELIAPDQDYPEKLAKAVELGEYQLTHALLALIFIHENNYNLPLPEGFVENVYSANVQLIDNDQTVTDLELEAAAFLYLADQKERVSNAFVENVIASQKSDGGWTQSSNQTNETNWHPTILALLILLHQQYPADSHPPTLAQVTS